MNTSLFVTILIGTFLCSLFAKDLGWQIQRFQVCFSDILVSHLWEKMCWQWSFSWNSVSVGANLTRCLVTENPGEGNGNPLQYSCLENSTDRGAWQAAVHWGHKESDTTEWLTQTHTHRTQLPQATHTPPHTELVIKCPILAPDVFYCSTVFF